MTYQELVEYLLKSGDSNFALFSKRLSNSVYESIGVKTPILRKLIKEHYLDEDLKLEDFEHQKYLEVDCVYFGVGLLRCKTIEEQLEFLLNNLKFANSWAVTDTLTVYLRKCSFEGFVDFFNKTYKSEHVYTRRFAYVFALKYSNDKRILDIINKMIENEDYMVMMGEAWLLSFVAIYFPQEVLSYLRNSNDLSLKRKAISKICDSYRFDEETKNEFKKLRP